jgi:drug/metabolite transporter (DMT)-like permease
MEIRSKFFKPGVIGALAAPILFGAGAPLSKLLLRDADPWLAAGILYLGSGAGVTAYRVLRRLPFPRLSGREWALLLGAVVFGGMIGPVLMMYGLSAMPASGASLLLNTESVFTVAIAWLVFRENLGRRIAIGICAIIAGAVVISWPSDARFSAVLPALAVIGACLSWAIDNNLTCRVSHLDAGFIASVKGLFAGSVNAVIAASLGAKLPALPITAGLLLVGCFSYGVSLVFFVGALRNLGAARTGAFIAVAPFFGAVLSIPLLHEQISAQLALAGALMATGVWLQLTEKHEHAHAHEPVEHEHVHSHDQHHQHEHEGDCAPETTHSHFHSHPPVTHTHDHRPDIHHRHEH